MARGVAIHTTGIIIMTVIMLGATIVILKGWSDIHQSEVATAACAKAKNTYCVSWAANGYSPDSKPSWSTIGAVCQGQPGYTEDGPSVSECRAQG